MSNFRDWMYNRWGRNGLTPQFLAGVEQFCDWAFIQQNQHEIMCPCSVCDCAWPPLDRNTVVNHLHQKGFRAEYYIWDRHGEDYGQQGVTFDIGGAGPSSAEVHHPEYAFQHDRDFVHDWFPQYNHYEEGQVPNEPNDDAKDFYDLIAAADKPLYEGHDMSLLHWINGVMKFKTKHNSTQEQVNAHIRGCRGTALPQHQHHIPNSYYKMKTMMLKLGLGVIKYDVCENNCCIFYNEYADLRHCPSCGHPRYKPLGLGGKTESPYKKLWYFPITKRLQRLYMSKKTAEHMTWHTKCQGWSDQMVHPADSETWKRFDLDHPEFAGEIRNVRVGLCTDGFCPIEKFGSSYSCWPVFITPYNLPPDLCMREEFIFMSLMISGPSSPGNKIDVMLRPLIDELKTLWSDGAVTWDCIKQENFQMRVAVMWTISDFPAYGMLSGWSTHGRLSCPYCQGDTDAFRLYHGGKPCWFDCHRVFLPPSHPLRYNDVDFKTGNVVHKVLPERKTMVESMNQLYNLPDIDIMRDEEFPGKGVTHNWTRKPALHELPYWCTLRVPHNLDVMHCEKNFTDNILNTVMDNGKKSKDNKKARQDLALHTGRESLYLREGSTRKIKAAYTVTSEQRRAICEWLQELRFPDGHVSNLQSNVKVDGSYRIKGLKTHDCHVFMQRLIPIAFKKFLPDIVWEALVEVSNAFRSICASVISASQMNELGRSVVNFMCKLEMIFPPSFFDCMEHLLIHLPYECQVCGSVFYRWMYPFERKLGILKNMARQKNRLEGSICEAYLMREIVIFCDFFFGNESTDATTRLRRNETLWQEQFPGQLSIFIPKGVPLQRFMKEKNLDQTEYDQALLCIVMNCPELLNLTRQYERCIPSHYSVEQREIARLEGMLPWLRGLGQSGQLGHENVEFIFNGGSYTVLECQGYTVNGYKFETEKYGKHKSATMNYGVCVKMDGENETTINFYGVIKEIIRFSFNCPGQDVQHIYLFKCDWFDNQYVVVDNFGLISLRPSNKLKTKEPFILADHATQVYYSTYPYTKIGRHRTVWSVQPIRARHVIDLSSVESRQHQPNAEQQFYQDEPPPVSTLFQEFTTYNLQLELADNVVGEVDAE